MIVVSCSVLLGILVQQDLILPSISSAYEESPTVFIGEVIDSEAIGDSMSVTFRITELLRGTYEFGDHVILHTPHPSFGPDAPPDANMIVPPPESFPTGANAFSTGWSYLVFADSESRITCCASEGDGYYLLYPHSDYYRTYDLWINHYQEDILTSQNLIELQIGTPLTQPERYSVTASLPGNSDTIFFGLRNSDDQYFVESDIEEIDGLRVFIHFLRRTGNEQHCRDANDVAVTILREQRIIGRLLGTVESSSSDGIELRLYLTKPFAEEITQFYQQDYITSNEQPSGFSITLYRMMQRNRREIGNVEIRFDEGAIFDARLNDVSVALVLSSSYFPLAVMPDCRYLVIQKSYFGMEDDKSDYIALRMNELPEDYDGDIPSQLYQWCLEHGGMQGSAYVIDGQTSQSRWFSYYEVHFRDY
ncbi:MAG: hypothetical protein GF388_07895 [Candidatus Aegiribacteria sp.]|nr:hypothetical protein [Candidatus Aegiribacteria sp.]